MKRRFKIKGMPKDAEFGSMPFGRQIELWPKIEEFKREAQVGHVSQKHQSSTSAIREFCKLNDVSEFFCEFWDDEHHWDDTFEIFYKVK